MVMGSDGATSSMLSGVLEEVGIFGTVGGLVGFTTHVMKLIDKICRDGLQSLMGDCMSGISGTVAMMGLVGITLMVIGMFGITLTGVGAAVMPIFMGVAGVLVKKLGPLICKYGFKAAAKLFFLGISP